MIVGPLLHMASTIVLCCKVKVSDIRYSVWMTVGPLLHMASTTVLCCKVKVEEIQILGIQFG